MGNGAGNGTMRAHNVPHPVAIILSQYVLVLGVSHVLHEAVNQHLLAACWADAPCSALQTQVLHPERLDRLQGHVDGIVHDVWRIGLECGAREGVQLYSTKMLAAGLVARGWVGWIRSGVGCRGFLFVCVEFLCAEQFVFGFQVFLEMCLRGDGSNDDVCWGLQMCTFDV